MPYPLLRRAGGSAAGLHRTVVGRGRVYARLLRGLHAARRLEHVWPGATYASRAYPLGGNGDGHRLERLYGGRGAVGRARRRRSVGGTGQITNNRIRHGEAGEMATAEELREALDDYLVRAQTSERVQRTLKNWDCVMHLEATDIGETYTMTVNDGAAASVEDGLRGAPDLVI